MRITLPYPGARGGEIELIGNPIKYSKTPVAYDRPPPRLGEHSEQVLEELRDLRPRGATTAPSIRVLARLSLRPGPAGGISGL